MMTCIRIKYLSIVIYPMVIIFSMTLSGPMPLARASVLGLPEPGTMVNLSKNFMPASLIGIKVNPQNPLELNFLIEPGDKALSEVQKRNEYLKLIKYFLAALTTPEKDMWVNLSPYEGNRIIANDFGQTQIGCDLLAQDYILKQLTASLIYPQKDLGKKFWDAVYSRTRAQFGTTQVPVSTFNKVWIIPQSATVYENGHTAMVVKSHLKVMLEEDYLAMDKNVRAAKMGLKENDIKFKATSAVSSQVLREIIIPAIEQEVNEGGHFAPLRQIYKATILAAWFKKRLHESILGKIYVDHAKTQGIALNDITQNQQIFEQYLKAYKKGVYNFIKEDVDPLTQQAVPRKYFSGGAVMNVEASKAMIVIKGDVPKIFTDGRTFDEASIALDASNHANAAMNAEELTAILRQTDLYIPKKTQVREISPNNFGITDAGLKETLDSKMAALRIRTQFDQKLPNDSHVSLTIRVEQQHDVSEQGLIRKIVNFNVIITPLAPVTKLMPAPAPEITVEQVTHILEQADHMDGFTDIEKLDSGAFRVKKARFLIWKDTNEEAMSRELSRYNQHEGSVIRVSDLNINQESFIDYGVYSKYRTGDFILDFVNPAMASPAMISGKVRAMLDKIETWANAISQEQSPELPVFKFLIPTTATVTVLPGKNIRIEDAHILFPNTELEDRNRIMHRIGNGDDELTFIKKDVGVRFAFPFSTRIRFYGIGFTVREKHSQATKVEDHQSWLNSRLSKFGVSLTNQTRLIFQKDGSVRVINARVKATIPSERIYQDMIRNLLSQSYRKTFFSDVKIKRKTSKDFTRYVLYKVGFTVVAPSDPAMLLFDPEMLQDSLRSVNEMLSLVHNPVLITLMKITRQGILVSKDTRSENPATKLILAYLGQEISLRPISVYQQRDLSDPEPGIYLYTHKVMEPDLILGKVVAIETALIKLRSLLEHEVERNSQPKFDTAEDVLSLLQKAGLDFRIYELKVDKMSKGEFKVTDAGVSVPYGPYTIQDVQAQVERSINSFLPKTRRVHISNLKIIDKRRRSEYLNLSLNFTADLAMNSLARSTSHLSTFKQSDVDGGIDLENKPGSIMFEGQKVVVHVPTGFEWLFKVSISGFMPRLKEINTGNYDTLPFFSEIRIINK